jgi:mono/diheme cytochrome c family protein
MRRLPLMAMTAALCVFSIQAQAADVEAGKAKFQQLCAVCHGASGAGDGPASPGLNPKPRKLGDAEWQASVSEEHLRKVITEGGPAVGLSPLMTAQKGLTPEELDNIIAFIRSLAPQG